MTLIAIGSLLAAAISSALAGYTWSRPATRGATCFTGLVVCIAGWCLASAGGSVSPSLEAKLLWSQIACSSVAVGSLVWLFFALEHAAAPTIAERKSLLLLFLVPSATVALVWTNSMHGLIWGGASMRSPDQLLATPGPWLVWAHIPYSVALIVAGQGVLIAHGLRSSAVYRLRSAILTVAAAVPLVVGAAFFGSAAASGADPTPLAFSIAGPETALEAAVAVVRLLGFGVAAEPPRHARGPAELGNVGGA